VSIFAVSLLSGMSVGIFIAVIGIVGEVRRIRLLIERGQEKDA